MSEETNALSRLARLNNNEDLEKMTESMSIDDYLEEDEDDIISKMKPAVQESAEEPTIGIDVTDTGDDSFNEELFNNNIVEEKPKRKGRPAKKAEQPVPVVKETKSTVVTNPLYDQLLKNMVADLRKHKYKYDGFNDESMNILFEYLESKI